LKRAEDEYALATTTAARKRELGNAVAELRAEVATLKKYSFLIGATDPFMVVPAPLRTVVTRLSPETMR